MASPNLSSYVIVHKSPRLLTDDLDDNESTEREIYWMNRINDILLNIEQKELKLIEDPCHDIPQEKVLTAKHKYDDYKVGKMVKDGQYDPSFPKAMSCILNTVISAEGPLSQSLIRRWFVKYDRVGGGNYGQAYRIKVDKSTLNNTPYVVKMTQIPKDSLVHEAFVGLKCLNNLRGIIPNFVYTFGIAKNMPDINKYNELDEMNGSHEHLFIERIDNIINIATLPNDAILIILLQIFYSLSLAHDKYEYTHYDLHLGNLLIKELKEETQIRYPLKSGDRYVKTKYLAVIIDYGFSHVKVDGVNYGINYPSLISKDEDYPITDIVLLLTDIRQRRIGSDIAKYILREILDFDVSMISLRVPFKSRLKVFTYESVIDIIERMTVVRREPYDIPYWGCEGGNCETIEDILNKIKDETEVPTLFDVYEGFIKTGRNIYSDLDPVILLKEANKDISRSGLFIQDEYKVLSKDNTYNLAKFIIKFYDNIEAYNWWIDYNKDEIIADNIDFYRIVSREMLKNIHRAYLPDIFSDQLDATFIKLLSLYTR